MNTSSNQNQKSNNSSKDKTKKWCEILLGIVTIMLTLIGTGASVKLGLFPSLFSIESCNCSINFPDDKSKEYDELSDANAYLISGDYESARKIYEKNDYANNDAVQINLGYIYANYMESTEENLEKAVKLYKGVHSVEADRNLLAFYIKHEMKDEAIQLMGELVCKDDTTTVNFISDSLKGLYRYDDIVNIDDEKLSDVIDLLLEKVATTNYERSYNPPSDSVLSEWVYNGIDFSVNGNINHPYPIYQEYKARCADYIGQIEKIYYMDDGSIIELKL